MVDAQLRQQALDRSWLERQRERAALNRCPGAGRKPNVASLFAHLPPPPSEDEWQRYLHSVDTRDGSAQAQPSVM